MEIKLEPQDLKNVSTFEPQASLGYLNMKIKEKLVAQCRENGHIPHLRKIAEIPDPKYESRQWGYQCLICDTRLAPMHFTEI